MLVLDASVALSWLLPDEHHAHALHVRDRITSARAHVTNFWRCEILNALLMAGRRKRYDLSRLNEDTRALALLPIDMDEETWTHAWSEAARLAQTHRLTAYDAAYLELAKRLGCPLATFDGELAAAARAVNVALL